MDNYKNKHRIGVKAMAMVLVCLFATNIVFLADLAAGAGTGINRYTLAAQSRFAALIDEGIFPSLQTEFEILTGVKLLLAGETYSAVNGTLIEKHGDGIERGKSNIEFLPGVERSSDGNKIRAEFVVKDREDVIFEVEYDGTERERVLSRERPFGGETTVSDRGPEEVLSVRQLRRGNIFQENDRFIITRSELDYGIFSSKELEKGVYQRIAAKKILEAEISFEEIEKQLFPYGSFTAEEKKRISEIDASTFRYHDFKYRGEQDLYRKITVALEQLKHSEVFGQYREQYELCKKNFIESLNVYGNIIAGAQAGEDDRARSAKTLIFHRGRLEKAISNIILFNYLYVRSKYLYEKKDGKIRRVSDIVSRSHSIGLNGTIIYKMLKGADIKENDVVLDMFGGPGNLLSFLSTYKGPSKMIASDIAYGMPQKEGELCYAIEENMAEMQRYLDVIPDVLRMKLRKIDIMKGDAENLGIMASSVDKIFGDPPYGREGAGVLEADAFTLFIRSLREADRVLKAGGEARFAVPSEWGEVLKDIIDEGSRERTPEELFESVCRAIKDSDFYKKKFYNKGEPFPEQKFDEQAWLETKNILEDLFLTSDIFTFETFRVEPSFYFPVNIIKLSKPVPGTLKDQQGLCEENNDEKYILTRASRFLNSSLVNMRIDLTSIPEEKGQLEQNMKTLAYLIARQNMFGLDVRYILENDTGGRGLSMLMDELAKIGEISGLDVKELSGRVGDPYAGDKVIEVKLKRLESVEKGKVINGREYIVALKDDNSKPGISIPNYTAAAAMGLSLAALRVARDDLEEDPGDQKKYEAFRGRILDKFRDIYERFGVIKNKNDFSERELELMVTGSSDTRLYYTLLYALPPVVKGAIELIDQYHERLQLILQSA
ncbi:MAG: hypothetical protein U9R44_00405 [Candidatus Omnitrophota bacterium]|nr:hypothetical protein [Candidatus Omnitrophota bacterium]